MKNNRIAFDAVMTAFAMILSYVESLLPIYIGIPGAKIGLPNLVILIVLMKSGIPDAVMINFVRIVLTGFLFGNLYGILYSFAGAALSMCVMILCRRIRSLSIIGISLAGGVSHNIGQLLIAAFVVKTAGVFYYLPFLMIAGILTGLLIGIVARILCRTIKRVDGENL